MILAWKQAGRFKFDPVGVVGFLQSGSVGKSWVNRTRGARLSLSGTAQTEQGRMNMLGLRKIFIMAALVFAVVGTSGIRPAGAVVFVFNGICNNTTQCAGTGTDFEFGTVVSGTLVLEATITNPLQLFDGGNIYADQITSFSLAFNPDPLVTGVSNPFDFVPAFVPVIANMAGVVGDFKVDLGLLGIENISFFDSDVERDGNGDPILEMGNEISAPNRFTFNDDENSAGWTLRSVQPPARGAGGGPLSFTQAIPEPSSLMTFLFGSVGLLVLARRRRVSQART